MMMMMDDDDASWMMMMMLRMRTRMVMMKMEVNYAQRWSAHNAIAFYNLNYHCIKSHRLQGR